MKSYMDGLSPADREADEKTSQEVLVGSAHRDELYEIIAYASKDRGFRQGDLAAACRRASRRVDREAIRSATEDFVPEAVSRRQDRAERGIGGGRGIRTPDTLSGTTVFKTAAINRSAIPPRREIQITRLPARPGRAVRSSARRSAR